MRFWHPALRKRGRIPSQPDLASPVKASLALQKRRAFLLGAAAIGASLAGCGSDTSDSPTPGSTVYETWFLTCPANRFSPIIVDVMDVTTGQAIPNATGTAVYTDGTTVPMDQTGTAAGQVASDFHSYDPGLWTVTVRAPGYREWSSGRVEVPYRTAENPCPQTRRLQAYLFKLDAESAANLRSSAKSDV